MDFQLLHQGWSGHMDFSVCTSKRQENKKVKNKPLFAKVDYSLKHVQKDAVWKDILVKDAMWCFPSERDFKQKIRKVYSDNGMYKSWAKTLADHLRSELSLSNVLEKNAQNTYSRKVVGQTRMLFC